MYPVPCEMGESLNHRVVVELQAVSDCLVLLGILQKYDGVGNACL